MSSTTTLKTSSAGSLSSSVVIRPRGTRSEKKEEAPPTKRKLKLSTPRSLSEGCAVTRAIDSLMATATRVVTERKTVITPAMMRDGYDRVLESTPEYKFDTNTISLLQGLLGPATYKFKLSRAATLTSGTGTFNITSSTDLLQYAEGSALVALFEEARLLRGKYVMIPGDLTSHTACGFQMGWYPAYVVGSVSPTPTTIARLRYQIGFATVYNGSEHILNFRTSGRMFGNTSAEGSKTAPVSPVVGFDGTVMWTATGGGTPSNSIVYYSYVASVIGEFRCRT